MPPPPPRIFFGRDDLIEEIVDFVQHLKPIALLGAGGIGKTSIALTVLHDDRVKQRFGDERRFIRCDQFPSSLTHFLRQLSKVIGSDVENPEDLVSLRPFLSSKEMFIVLDNAESILDPQIPNSEEVYASIEELSEFKNIYLCVTSRISTIPPNCETLEVPTLSVEAARDTFHSIYKRGKESESVDEILNKLEFHPLSVTLLATVAQQSRWDIDRLTREWESRRTGVLKTGHKKSLAATIELSLASPMFRDLGSDARGLLGVVAFFPQGVNGENLDWLFPAVSNGEDIFDKFCSLSLTYRSKRFVKMLAPLRDYLSPKDPLSSPPLCATKDCYFARLSVHLNPNEPSFGESRWIISEDVNVEHLLNVFISIDVNLENIWRACANFLDHLKWHKPRLTTLGPKIEALPDDYLGKPLCLQRISRLANATGNLLEGKRLLTVLLKLCKNQGDLPPIAMTLVDLSEVNWALGLCEEGIREAREALKIFERLGNTVYQAHCLSRLAQLLRQDGQLDAAEEAVSRAITLADNNQFLLNQCHHFLGGVYRSKGNKEKYIEHLEISLRIASSHNWHQDAFWSLKGLVEVFCEMGRIDDANSHLEQARSHTANNALDSAYLIAVQALIWSYQGRLEEAVFQYSRAIDALEELGATRDAEVYRNYIGIIRRRLASRPLPMHQARMVSTEPSLHPALVNLPSRTGKNLNHNPMTRRGRWPIPPTYCDLPQS